MHTTAPISPVYTPIFFATVSEKLEIVRQVVAMYLTFATIPVTHAYFTNAPAPAPPKTPTSRGAARCVNTLKRFLRAAPKTAGWVFIYLFILIVERFKIASQVNITMSNSPGSLARMTDALLGCNINIDAICCTEGSDNSTIHMITNDAEAAVAALTGMGKVSHTEVLAFSRKNNKGAIHNLTRRLAGLGINIRNVYATTHGKGTSSMVYIAVDNIEESKNILRIAK